jgi:hypothetical protein
MIRGNEKRGQVTIFIIVGIMIVIIVGILFLVSDKGFSKRTLSPVQVEPLKIYLEECIERIAKEDLNEMRRHGGYLNTAHLNTLDCDGEDTVVLATRDDNIARNNLAIELVPNLERRIKDECGLGLFDNQFNIVEGIPEVEISFGAKSVDIIVDTKTSVGKGISGSRLGSIFVGIDDDILSVNEIAKEITRRHVNDEPTTDILTDINGGDVVLSGVTLISKKILGEDCSLDASTGNFARPGCSISCPSGCCNLGNKFAEENKLNQFRFTIAG